jgi:hypothetical protein
VVIGYLARLYHVDKKFFSPIWAKSMRRELATVPKGDAKNTEVTEILII